jgi:hypothetical protein
MAQLKSITIWIMTVSVEEKWALKNATNGTSQYNSCYNIFWSNQTWLITQEDFIAFIGRESFKHKIIIWLFIQNVNVSYYVFTEERNPPFPILMRKFWHYLSMIYPSDRLLNTHKEASTFSCESLNHSNNSASHYTFPQIVVKVGTKYRC